MLRIKQLTSWLNQIFAPQHVSLMPLAGDAGFRRYFRITLSMSDKNHGSCSYIAVDAPNEYSNNGQFIKVQQYLSSQNINVPQIIDVDIKQGFLCLSDLGQQTLSDVITPENMAYYYQQALAIALSISSIKVNQKPDFPIYDAAFVQRELTIFDEWLLLAHLGIELSAAEKTKLSACFSLLVNNAIEQPQVVMHRDFHSRNLMLHTLHDEQKLAVIDFQDAVIGPITYDAVSLLKDCYIRWPKEKIIPLFQQFCDDLSVQHQLAEINFQQWQRWFDLMGLQRHLKAAGIFARLHHRDNKSHYLQDLPLTLQYIADICEQYTEFRFIGQLVNDRIIPQINKLSQQ